MDNDGQTFLHAAAKHSSTEMIRSILTILHREVALNLAKLQDNSNRVPRDYCNGLKRDFVDQAGSYVIDFYPLDKPPAVLIFYNTNDRHTQELDVHTADAEAEKDCVYKFFTDRNFVCHTRRNPTAGDVFSAISHSQNDENLSGLIVFIMAHGHKGVISLKGHSECVPLNHIISYMCVSTAAKPKVCSTNPS